MIRNGKLVAEHYYHGAQATDGLDIHSCTKSFTSALYGIALAAGDLTVDQFYSSVYSLLPEYAPADPKDPRWAITPAHLLTMSAGFQWKEGAGAWKAWLTAPDPFAYTLSLPLAAPPGQAWNYDSGLTHVAGRILTQVTGKDLYDYAEEKLFQPLGIEPTRWEHDVKGYKFGSGGMMMKPRDMARLGYLYLNHGQVDDKQIVPSAWVDATTKPAFSTGNAARPGQYYGAGWWIDMIAGHPVYTASGFGGQWILVVPDLELVIVITSKGDVPGEMDSVEETVILELLENYLVPAVQP
jgi:CubicO group peptidase (beta-lactamase class C family)